MDFEKIVDSVEGEALWFKMRKIGVNGNVR
jgi:hypothetical protein